MFWKIFLCATAHYIPFLPFSICVFRQTQLYCVVSALGNTKLHRRRLTKIYRNKVTKIYSTRASSNTAQQPNHNMGCKWRPESHLGFQFLWYLCKMLLEDDVQICNWVLGHSQGLFTDGGSLITSISTPCIWLERGWE